MKCPECGSEMENGLLANRYWRPLMGVDSLSPNKWFLGAKKIDAYACPQCGKIELRTIVENK